MKNIGKTRVMAGTAVLSAVAVILSYLEFTMPFSPAFAKMDFSDLPALLAAFAYGPMAGITTELVKNLLHLTASATGGVGELANFLIGASVVGTAGVVYQKSKSRKTALIGMIVGSFIMGIVATLMNYFVLLPFYTAFMPMDEMIAAFAAFIPFIHNKLDVCIFSAFPTTFGKGIVVSAITFALYKRLRPILKGRNA